MLPQEANKILIFGDDDSRTARSCDVEDRRVVLSEEADVVDVFGKDPVLLSEPSSERGRQLGVDPDATSRERTQLRTRGHSGSKARVVYPLGRIQQTGSNVLSLKVRIVL
jgi:endonuclease/exonuclease/phosphatase family metal-dependent hydrolase